MPSHPDRVRRNYCGDASKEDCIHVWIYFYSLKSYRCMLCGMEILDINLINERKQEILNNLLPK